jgi:hypothetical protein
MRRKVMCSSRERIRMRVRVYGCTENMSGAGGGSDGSGGTKHSLRLCEHNTTQLKTTYV